MDLRNNTARKHLVEQPLEVEICYRKLVERMPAAIFYVDASDNVSSALYMSPQVEDMLGYTPEEWLTDSELWIKTLHPEDRERVLAEHARTRTSGEPFVVEYRLVARNGHAVWVRDEAAFSPAEDGQSECWRGVLIDIAERKEIEEALQRSEERHRLVAKATGEAIWDNNLLTGRQEWAGATEALFGYLPHEGSKGEWWEERIHTEDRERVLSSLQTMYDNHEEAWSDEYRFRRADGTYAMVVDRGFVVRDEVGRAVRMVGSMADVTERRRWEAALKESEERYRVTFDAVPVGLAHVAPDGQWLLVNEKLCELSGYTRKELLSLTYLDLSPPEDLEAGLKRVGRLLRGEIGPYTVERRYIRKDGSRVWVKLSVSLIPKMPGEPAYFACIAEDITERKLRELVPNSLTRRELEVLELVAWWQTDWEIAQKLKYSEGTIKACVRCILAKLGVRNRRRAAARAVEIGLICPPR